MKKNRGFWQELEKYLYGLVKRSYLPRYSKWIGVGMVVVVMVSSLLNVKNSTVGARELREVIEQAVSLGDYDLAQKLYKMQGVKILGAETELEDKVYPERVVARRIAELEAKLDVYPENREIYKGLGELYDQIGDIERADEYRKKARVLDPNEVEF